MKKKGFTLIELLSVIIVITIISLITVPVIINVIETSKKASFKDSVLIAYRSIDLKLYELKVDQMPDEGLEVKDLSIKSNFKSGKFLKNEEGKTISYFITDGEYCAYGEIRDLKIEKGCKNLDITGPILDESKLIITSKSSEIKLNILENFAIDEESGIKSYEINLYKGDDLIDPKELTEIGQVIFNKLTSGIKYKIEIKVSNKKGLEESLTKTIETSKIEVPTYSVSPSGWSQSKTVTINYPSGYTNEYSLDSGLTWKTYTGAITFTTNTTVIGRVTDGTNYVTGSSQTVTQIDTTLPTSSTFTYTKTSKSISITATGIDNESGILYYQYSKDNGATWTNVQTSNIYTYNNLTTGTYKIKVRVHNGTYKNGEGGGHLDSITQDVTTSTIPAPTYFVSPSGWSQSKTVTINYPSGYTDEYSTDSGLTWKPYSSPITLTSNSTVIGRVTDGTNYVTGSSQTVSLIDTTSPTVTINSKLPSSVTKGDSYELMGSYTTSSLSGGSASCVSDINSTVTNTSTLSVGTHKITCTSKTGAGKVATASATVKITYTPYSATNLFVGGSFESGISNYSCYNTCPTISSNYKLYGNSSIYVKSAIGQREIAVIPKNAVSIVSNHIYYLAVNTNYVSYSQGFKNALYVANLGTVVVVHGDKNSGWQVSSNIFTSSQSASISDIRVGKCFGYDDVIYEAYLDGARIIDLTVTFGAGNEPDKVWCDKHIKWFDGTSTIYK